MEGLIGMVVTTAAPLAVPATPKAKADVLSVGCSDSDLESIHVPDDAKPDAKPDDAKPDDAKRDDAKPSPKRMRGKCSPTKTPDAKDGAKPDATPAKLTRCNAMVIDSDQATCSSESIHVPDEITDHDAEPDSAKPDGAKPDSPAAQPHPAAARGEPDDAEPDAKPDGAKPDARVRAALARRPPIYKGKAKAKGKSKGQGKSKDQGKRKGSFRFKKDGKGWCIAEKIEVGPWLPAGWEVEVRHRTSRESKGVKDE